MAAVPAEPTPRTRSFEGLANGPRGRRSRPPRPWRSQLVYSWPWAMASHWVGRRPGHARPRRSQLVYSWPWMIATRWVGSRRGRPAGQMTFWTCVPSLTTKVALKIDRAGRRNGQRKVLVVLFEENT
jgi:hypothetical protein